jgi:hypothetical protein
MASEPGSLFVCAPLRGAVALTDGVAFGGGVAFVAIVYGFVPINIERVTPIRRISGTPLSVGGLTATLLRILADIRFIRRPTEVDENPLPRFTCVALLGHCCFCSLSPGGAEHGSPYPLRADACAVCGVGNSGWLLDCIEGKVSADTDNDARKTCRQIHPHDQSSGSPTCLSVKLAAFYSAAVAEGCCCNSPERILAFSSRSHKLWCSSAHLRSTVPWAIASNAPSMPIVPM